MGYAPPLAASLAALLAARLDEPLGFWNPSHRRPPSSFAPSPGIPFTCILNVLSLADAAMENIKKTGMLFQVRCACGAESTVAISAFGRPLRCRDCRGTFKLFWKQEPGSKKKAPQAVADSGTHPRVFEIPAGAQEVGCLCGQLFLAWPRQVGKRVQCPACGTWLKLERHKDPQTLETRIRTVESRINRLPSAPRAKAIPEPNHQEILCTCGESLRVGTEQSGEQIQCPACGVLMRLERERDSETSIIAITPPIIDPAEPCQKRGIDEELSLDDYT
jgi:hypothetical protein